MLSYQHAYHAGNLADLHKHALLAAVLDYLLRKSKPLSYIETHAGRGLYRLDGPEALRTGEAGAASAARARLAPDHPLARQLEETRTRYGEAAYPGSPLIAGLALRPGDRMHLAELHPQENAALRRVMAPFGADVRGEDGWAMALAATPPVPRRGLMLVDPSYEVKTDYAAIPGRIAAVARKWNVGVILLWYPLLAAPAHGAMLRALEAAHPGALRHEVAFGPAREGHRMLGSGLFVVNPPWGLAEEAAGIGRLFAP